ncbi:hypothetical protein B9Z55_007508 [Caenorhabditis nigoni]|uniref:Uncharacterized protein n=1 Tax=Caenorhabditis nigoni TaxID=1611254 RepID=A0A2G5VAA9_9PELO|nr:hypothetical protein B9Z55_007508 [Caenorhabditis nigoni]
MSAIESPIEPTESNNDFPIMERSKDSRKRRTRNPSVVIEEAVVGPAAPPRTVRRRRMLRNRKDPMDVGTRRNKLRRHIHAVHGKARPVKFQFRALKIREHRLIHSKRARVTRQIVNHRIHQYHADPEKGKRNVPELTVAETVENFLGTSKTVMQKSGTFHDELVAVGVEYGDSIKMLHFGKSMKKLSCRQKRVKLQQSWWPIKKDEEKEKARQRRGVHSICPYKIKEDPILFKNHWAFCPKENAPLQTIREHYMKNLMRRRATDDVILDSSFFVREFHLPKSSINLRITRSSDIPTVDVPPIMNCGYFPYSAKTVEDKKDYLAARFREAQLEYFNLTYRDIEPWNGFKVATISDTELYNYHRLGKHIHGFFLIWEKEGNRNMDRTKKHANGRYLVDMFNFQCFPLDVDFTKWEHRLRISFDKVSVYNLHLAEILRANKPVFDSLARNPSFFKPLTLKEIVQLMTEQGMSPKDYINKFGKRAFYEWGLEKTNEAYLSAYFIICAGSKIIQKNKKCVLEHPAVLIQGQEAIATMTKDGKVYHMEMKVQPTEILVNLDDWKHSRPIERLLVHGQMTKEEAETTNLITDTPRVDAATEVEEDPKKAIRLDTLTRKELIFVRSRLRGSPPPKLTMKKKKGPPSRPGRKPETLREKGLRKHDFNLPYLASDIESDFEDFLSGDEDYEEEVPKLKRSESSESVFANICKTDSFFDKVSGLYRQKLNPIVHSIAQRKSRKMNRIVKKHILRYRMLNQDGIAFKEMLECYHGNLPKLGSEITRTKKAIRVNGYKRFKVAKVFEKGESAKIDVIGDLLNEMVTHVVAQENVESRAANGMSRMAQRVRMAQRLTIENLKPANTGLPKAPYVAMELLTRKKMNGRRMMEEEKKKLRETVDEQFLEYSSMSDVERKKMDARIRTQQKEMIRNDLEDYEIERTRQLVKKQVFVRFDHRSIQSQVRREEERRTERLVHAERVANAEKEKKELETKRREAEIEIQKTTERRITAILMKAREEQEREGIEDVQEDVQEEEIADQSHRRSAQKEAQENDDPEEKRQRKLEHQRSDSEELRQNADLKRLNDQRNLARRARALEQQIEKLKKRKEMEEVLARRNENLEERRRREDEEEEARALKVNGLDHRYPLDAPGSSADKDSSLDDDEEPNAEKEKIQEDVPEFDFVRSLDPASPPRPPPSPYHDEYEYEDDDDEMTHLAEDAEVRFQLNIRNLLTKSVDLELMREKAKSREKEIKKCVDQIEEMNAELHRLRGTYAIQHKACENVDDDDAEIKLELARETLKNIRQLEEETKELETNLKERNSKMDKLRFKINNLMSEIKNATLNLSFLDMNLEQKQLWDEVRRTVTMEQEGISGPGNRNEGSEGSDNQKGYGNLRFFYICLQVTGRSKNIENRTSRYSKIYQGIFANLHQYQSHRETSAIEPSSIEPMEPRNDSPVIKNPKDPRKRLTRKPSVVIEEAIIGPAAPPKRVRRRLIKQKDPMDVGIRRHKFRRYIHPVHGMARPVKFRFRAITIKEYRHSHQKRVRVTRQIYNHRVHQYHMDPEKGKRNVPELTVAETVENFLEASKTVMPRSQKVHDEIVAVGVEYEDSIKMLHFGRSMKKHSCKQKRANLQKSWWPMKRLEEKARLRRGPQWISMDRPYKINEDPILFKNHWAFCPRKNSPLQTIREVYMKNLMRRRATDDVILDSSFFVREFYLPKSSISLRITRSSDIPEVHVPPIMNCGYFPYSAKTVENKKDYLAARFKEAQLEYFNLTYRDIEPWNGFKVATISDTELYNFHRLGKHLHGFFLVWEKIGKRNMDRTKTHSNGRYLVDMFNFQFFPLDVNFTKWELRLRIAFDKVSVYNLHLAEILRANKPVFDSLARNPSFFKPLTLKEIVQLMTELGMSPKDYINKSGKRAFYEWGLEKTNEAYLSAYFIICSGSKIIQKNKKCVLEHPAVLIQGPSDPYPGQMDIATMTKDGKVYHMEIPKLPTEFLVNLDDWKHNRPIDRVLVHGPMTKEEADTTNLITDTPRVDAATEVKEAPKKAVRLDTMTRKELIFVRSRRHGSPPPKLTMKKKKAPSSKPGRKPDTIQDKMLRKHDFNLPYLASDIESDYEDFLSGDEDYEDERPMLKRSESSESVFASIYKTDSFFDKVSGFYRQKVNPIVHPSARRKSRKMNRIAKKHILRYRMLNQDGIAFKEMLECYHGNLPKLGSEITRTKKAIRVNGYKRFKVAKVFEKGESAKIDVIGDLLKEMVTHVVAQENAESRAANGISRMAQRVRMAQRLTIENLKPANSGLPAAPYVAMELLTRTKMSGRKMLEEEKKKLRRRVHEQYEEYASMSAMEKKEMDVRIRAQQKEIRLEEVEDREVEKERWLNRKQVIVPFDQRTIQAQDRKTERRRLSRLELTKRERIAKNKERESAKLKESGLSVTEFLRQTALEDAERERKEEEEEEERRRRHAVEASRRAMEAKRREEAIEIQKKQDEKITAILMETREERKRIAEEERLRRSAPEDVQEEEVANRRRRRSAQKKVQEEEDPEDKRQRRLEHQRGGSEETRQYADLRSLDHQRRLARRARALKEEKEQLRIEKEMEEVRAQRQEDLRRLKEEQGPRARKAYSLDHRYRSKTPASPSDDDEESSDDEEPADEREKTQEDVPEFEEPSKTATPSPRPAPYHDESEYEDEGEEDADEANDPIAAEARFQLNLRTFMTQSVELDTKRDKAKRREKEIKKCVDQIEEMNAELHRLRSTYAGQLRECENVDDADAAIKLDLARETSKKIRQRNEETKELEANLKERLLKMDELQFKISILMDEVEYATINLSVLDMTPEQTKMWDDVRKLVTMDETSDPKETDEQDTEETSEDSNEPSDDPEHPLGEENHSAPTALSPLSSSRCTSDSSKLLLSYSKIQAIKDSVGRSMSRSTDSRISSSQPPSQDGHSNGVSSSQPSTSSSDQRSDATAPRPSTSSSTTAPIASGDGRRRGRKREATRRPKEADKKPRN